MERNILFFIITISVIWFLCLVSGLCVDLETIQKQANNLQLLVNRYYIQSIIAYCGIFIVSTLSAIPITPVLTVLSGYLFGAGIGFMVTIVSATIAALIILFVVRYAFASFVQKKYASYVEKFMQEFEHYGHWYLLIMQLFPFTPIFFIYVICGLTPISWYKFTLATVVGIVPGTALFTVAGTKLHEIKSMKDILSWQILVLLIIGSLFLFIPLLWNRIYHRFKIKK